MKDVKNQKEFFKNIFDNMKYSSKPLSLKHWEKPLHTCYYKAKLGHFYYHEGINKMFNIFFVCVFEF